MKSRLLAIITTAATLSPTFATPVLAQSRGAMPPVFQGQGRGGVRPAPAPAPVFQDRNRDPRERDLYDRYTGRDGQWQFAFRDGYNEGLRDGRANRRFDPTVSAQFRRGDRGYNRGWGPRDQFTIRYRMAFRDGYERGYLDARNRRGGLSLFFRWGR